MRYFQWLSHIELLRACYYLYRTRIWLTSGTSNYTYQEWSLSIIVQRSAAFLQWLDETLTQLDREWTSDYLPNSWLPYNPTNQRRTMRAINYNPMAFHIIKNIGILAQAWHYNQSAHHFLPCFTLHRSFTVISSHFREKKKHLSKMVDTILPRSDGTHSRGHTRAVWESCV
jgi:hypothetical protein